MKTYRKGSSYGLENFVDKSKEQLINFIEKERDGDSSYLVQDGTTNEELIKVIIDRIEFLNEKRSCFENFNALNHLKEANFWLKERIKSKDFRVKSAII